MTKELPTRNRSIIAVTSLNSDVIELDKRVANQSATTFGVESWNTMPIGFIVLLVLVGLCAVVGAIYAYLYFTRINPMCLKRSRKYVDPMAGQEEEAANPQPTASTHMFLFRK